MSQEISKKIVSDEYFRTMEGCFAVTPEIISSIDNIVRRFVESNHRVDVELSGGISKIDIDINEIQKMRNSGDDRIKELSWKDLSDRGKSIRISLARPRSAHGTGKVIVSAKGPEMDVAMLKQGIESIVEDMSLKGIELKFSENNPGSWASTALFVFLSISCIFIYAGWKFNFDIYKTINLDLFVSSIIIWPVYMLISIIICNVIESWMKHFYPNFYFYIGQEKIEVDKLRSNRFAMWATIISPFMFATMFYLLT
jgi:hypothetical protein